ncbi:hypothetical protein ACFX10_019935 [Malus domestica]
MGRLMSTMNLAVVLVAVAVVLFGRFCITDANVVLIGNNVTLSFDDLEASFAPAVKGSGECGVLYMAEPPDACSTLTNQVEQGTNRSSPFVLIVRGGGCSFEDKVRRAQKAGFKAAIIFDNEVSSVLVSKFHAFCVDSWLTSWRTFCPVCKRDARANTGDLPASESTPLLSSSPSSVASSVLSSMRSSIASSSAIQIGPALSRNPSLSHSHSYASTSHIQQSLRSSYRQSPSISASRSSMDLRNVSSQRSHASYFVSPNSFGYPSLLPPNSRYISVGHFPSPSNASPSYISSSSHRQHPLHCSESAATFSPFSSAQSLPEC